MKLTWLGLFLAAFLVTSGCAREEPPELEPQAGLTDPEATRDALNLTKLQAVPEAVRIAFLRDFPEAGITSIQTLDAATGRLLYEINFLREGLASDVIYDVDGNQLDEPAREAEF